MVRLSGQFTIELPSQDERSGGSWVVLLGKAIYIYIYGTRDAPLIWPATEEAMKQIGILCCTLQPGVYVNLERNIQMMILDVHSLLTEKFHELKWLDMRLMGEF